MSESITLSPAEIEALTGYKVPTMQLERLRKDWFYRAYIPRKGHPVVVPRPHYAAILEQRARPPDPVPKEEDCSQWLKPPRVHWRNLPQHQERLRLEREAVLAEEARVAEMDRLCAEQVQIWRAEMDRTRPERRAALVRHHAAKRRVATLKRTPPWADQKAIRAIYDEAIHLKRDTGEEHHVDHIIPLQGKLVSGLHVENNLQILHWRENILKRNHFEVEA